MIIYCISCIDYNSYIPSASLVLSNDVVDSDSSSSSSRVLPPAITGITAKASGFKASTSTESPQVLPPKMVAYSLESTKDL